MTQRHDLTGHRYGALVVVRIDRAATGRLRWLCRCDCGETTTVTAGNLRNGHTKSCGCLWRATIQRHGHAGRGDRSRTYTSWHGMVSRTTNPNHPRWPDWGGRGITVCDRWRSFENFLADMGERPAGTTLDRIDNDGSYEPGNCRWATPTVQRRNSRSSKLTTGVAGEIRRLYATGEFSYRALGRQFGVSHDTVGAVIRREREWTE